VYSSRTRVHIFKDSDSDFESFCKDSDSDAKDSPSDSNSSHQHSDSDSNGALRQYVYEDSVDVYLFSQLQLFSAPTVSVSVYGRVLSGSVKATQYTCHKLTLNSLTVPATAPCKCSAVGKSSCGHTGQDSQNKLEL